MAKQTQRMVNMTPLRILVVIALVFHAVGLFAMPFLSFLFSPDIRDLMKYGGRGASIAMNHPLVYAFYLVPYPALIAVFFGQNWGRYLLLFFYAVLALGSFYFGASVSGPPETFIAIVGLLVNGAVLGLAFLGRPAHLPE